MDDPILDIAAQYGLTLDDLRRMVFDSVATGICADCGAECDVEPDADGYDCESCGSEGSVSSILVLCGLI